MAQKPTFDYDVIVIGSGAGGSPAATVLARAGKKVAIIERGTFGGESPNWGDIPTGALLYTADVYHEAKTAAKFGLRTSTVGSSLGKTPPSSAPALAATAVITRNKASASLPAAPTFSVPTRLPSAAATYQRANS